MASGLNMLVQDGLLSRAPRRGTIVIKDYTNANSSVVCNEKENEKLASPIPSLYGMDYLFFIPETKILTFACFENFSGQKKMWGQLIEKFNAKSKGRKVDLKPVHIDNFTADGIKLSNEMKTPDIVQCLLCNTSPSKLRDLPDDLIAYTTGEDSLSANVLPDFKGILRKILPVYTTVPICVWNQEMEEKAGIKSLKKNIIEGKLVRTLCSSVSAFPSSLKKAGPHLSNLLRHYGTPFNPSEVNINYFRGFFDGIFEGLALLEKEDYKKVFIADREYKTYDSFSRKGSVYKFV